LSDSGAAHASPLQSGKYVRYRATEPSDRLFERLA
jgi:hypothetical protein